VSKIYSGPHEPRVIYLAILRITISAAVYLSDVLKNKGPVLNVAILFVGNCLRIYDAFESGV
jgi:hypothetical protein